MWFKLVKKEKEFIKQKLKLLEAHESYNKHNKNFPICECGKILKEHSLIPTLLKNNYLLYNLVLLANEPKDLLFSKSLYDKISLETLIEYKKHDTLAFLLQKEDISLKDKEAIVDLTSELAGYISEKLSYFNVQSEKIRNKIIEKAILNPKIKLNFWAINAIANMPHIPISNISNELAYSNSLLTRFSIPQKYLFRVFELISKYNLEHVELKIQKEEE